MTDPEDISSVSAEEGAAEEGTIQEVTPVPEEEPVTGDTAAVEGVNERGTEPPHEDSEPLPAIEEMTSPSSPFMSYSYSTIGASHLKKGLPCQDSSGHMTSDRYSIAVVADGHSDFHCFRSDVGSRIAVETVISHMGALLDGEGLDIFLDDVRHDRDNVLNDLWRVLLLAWRISVKRYDSANPVTDDEWEFLRSRIAAKYDNPKDVDGALSEVRAQSLFRRYGATLRIAIQHQSGYILMVLGDGETTVIGTDGHAFSPVPDDEDTEGSEVHSICESNAFDYSKYVVGWEPVIGIGLCSDGIHCSDFENDNKYFIGEHMKALFKGITLDSTEWVRGYRADIVEFSQNFPKDDCSIAFTLCKSYDKSVLETPVVPLEYFDEPVYESVRIRRFLSSRSYGYAVNSFDETNYRSRKGMEVMLDLVESFCSDEPSRLRGAPMNGREDAFFKDFKLLIQQWNRKITDYDAQNPDTDEERLKRLTNNIYILNKPEKYGVSVAVTMTLDGQSYTAFVGKGTVEICAGGEMKAISYDEGPESTATTSFRQIRTSFDKGVTSIVVRGISGKIDEIRLY